MVRPRTAKSGSTVPTVRKIRKHESDHRWRTGVRSCFDILYDLVDPLRRSRDYLIAKMSKEQIIVRTSEYVDQLEAVLKRVYQDFVESNGDELPESSTSEFTLERARCRFAAIQSEGVSKSGQKIVHNIRHYSEDLFEDSGYLSLDGSPEPSCFSEMGLRGSFSNDPELLEEPSIDVPVMKLNTPALMDASSLSTLLGLSDSITPQLHLQPTKRRRPLCRRTKRKLQRTEEPRGEPSLFDRPESQELFEQNFTTLRHEPDE